jgi:hypothetical protein
MKIPEKVKIGGITYEVKQGVERLNNDDFCAQIFYRTGQIEVKNGLQEQVAQRSFLHEVIHAVRSNLGYDQSDDEHVTDELAGALYALIVDNPEMFGG